MRKTVMSLVAEIDYGAPASRSDKPVTLTIDGMEVHVPEGTSIMRAAMEVGTKIPKLCATDMLEAFGSCRLCLVEIQGRAGTPASCTTPVAPGMVVHPQTERLKALRRGVMELYISDHPLDCLTCAANGNCELQTEAGNVGLRDVRYGYAGANHLADKKDESNPYFSYDPAKCIVCNRCIRACEEVQGTFALTIDGRGFGSRVSAGQMEPFLESECVSCGACVQACPTATLVEKSVIDIGQAEHSAVTTCGYCGVGCSFKAEMRGEELVRMVPYKDGKANHGHSCVKGRFAWGYATHRDRILNPMIRAKVSDPWREVSWDEAFAYSASEFKRIQAKYGKNSVGAITSSRCTNEETYLIQKLVRAGFGNNNVDTCARVCHSPTGYGLKTAFGTSAGTQDFDSVDEADDDCRGQPDRCTSGLRLTDEKKAARGRQAHYPRPAPHRSRAHAACRGRLSSAFATRHQCRGLDRACPCHRDRRSGERGFRARPLRLGGIPGMGGVRVGSPQ